MPTTAAAYHAVMSLETKRKVTLSSSMNLVESCHLWSVCDGDGHYDLRSAREEGVR
jgi:hypothetical protein